MIFRLVNAAAVAALLAGGFTSPALAAQWLRCPPGVLMLDDRNAVDESCLENEKSLARMQSTPQR